MKYSVVLPYYDPEYRKTEVFTRCVEAVCKNSRDYELVIVKDGPSYVESHNIGLRAAKGDHIAVINDDVIVTPNWLDALCSDDAIVSHYSGPSNFLYICNASCFMMSRQVFNKLGLMDEAFKDGIDFADTDYFRRARQLGIPFRHKDLGIIHEAMLTERMYPVNRAPLVEINKHIYLNKWK